MPAFPGIKGMEEGREGSPSIGRKHGMACDKPMGSAGKTSSIGR